MSVRAYKVLIPAVVAESQSFSLSHDQDFLNWCRENGEVWESENRGDRIEFPVSTLRKAIKHYPFTEEELYIKKCLKRDIKGELSQNYIMYECF